VGGRTRILACLLIGALALLSAGPALAQGGGTTTSAGDQQYIDPLATTTATTPAPTTPAPSTSAPSTTTPAASSSSAPTPTATTTSQAPTTSTTPGASGNTLPYTGLNLGLVIAVGLGLIGGGFLLLRLARRA
jgi:hypothetical protein